MNISSQLPFYNLNNYEFVSYTSQYGNDHDSINFTIEQLNLMTYKQFDTIDNDNSNFNQDFVDRFFVDSSSSIDDWQLLFC